MPLLDPVKNLLRQLRFETFEERLALSAQPLAEVIPVVTNQEIADYGEMAPALSEIGQSAGIDYVHQTYGLTGEGQTVAVIDTGIAYDHTSLGGGFGAGSRVIAGWDFAENDANPYDDGPFGFHGTHVAGIIGSDHSIHTGIAPEVDLVALRVFDDAGYGNLGWVESALDWVDQHRQQYNITAVNLSLGTEWNSNNVPNWANLEDEFQQLESAGVFIAVAAGNSFQQYDQVGLSYPAASSHVVPVASHGDNDQLSSFSQRNERILAAPGESIKSTIPSHVFGGSGPSSYFMSASGTSMAAPVVAGASTLVREAMTVAGFENITQQTIYDHLRSTASTIYDGVTDANYHQLDLRSAFDTLLVDDYGSTSAAAHQLGTLLDGESFHGMIGQTGDVDVFSFTAGQTGTITLNASVNHELVADWQLEGGSSAVGNQFQFDVVAGQDYVFSLRSADGLGSYDVFAQLGSSSNTPDPGQQQLVELAFGLDHQLGLSTSGNYWENWGGLGERWIEGNDGWYFITSQGELYQWNGDADLNQSSLVATLDSTYHADPSRLHDSQSPFGPQTNTTQRAAGLDNLLSLRFHHSYYENWGGAGEKWMMGNGGWYFITPSGDLYQWDGAAALDSSPRIDTLDGSFHADPTQLHDASSSAPGPGQQALDNTSISAGKSQSNSSQAGGTHAGGSQAGTNHSGIALSSSSSAGTLPTGSWSNGSQLVFVGSGSETVQNWMLPGYTAQEIGPADNTLNRIDAQPTNVARHTTATPKHVSSGSSVVNTTMLVNLLELDMQVVQEALRQIDLDQLDLDAPVAPQQRSPDATTLDRTVLAADQWFQIIGGTRQLES